MCCCGKPVINGEDGYSWDGKSTSVRKPFFPTLEEGDELIMDLPGRCGGIDSHSHDFRLVRRKITGLDLLVNHGGGQERMRLHAYGGADKFIEAMSENDCYWMMRMLHGVQSDAARNARDLEARKWRVAAAENRIKTRKRQRRSGTCSNSVYIRVHKMYTLYTFVHKCTHVQLSPKLKL